MRQQAWRASRIVVCAVLLTGLAGCSDSAPSKSTSPGTQTHGSPPPPQLPQTGQSSPPFSRNKGKPAGHSVASARPLSARPHVVARGIPFPTNVAFDSKGRMFVTSGSGGSSSTDGIWYVPRVGRPRQVASGLKTALGLVWAGQDLYVGHITTPSNGRVTRFSGFTGHGFRTRAVAIDRLLVGRHTVDSIVRGPGGRLFVGVGSTGDSGGHPGQVLSFSPRGDSVKVEATGLRNPYGLSFRARRLFVTDNARDDLGPFRPPEELDAFDPAGPAVNFGFPGCYDQGGARCKRTSSPRATLPAHASADGLAIRGGEAFVAENGSSFSANPTGSDVRRVNLRTGRAHAFWRSPVKYDPLGATIGPRGDLYVTLFRSGEVIRFVGR
jgi:glucose/arabinose dehydrogenase